MKNYQSLNYYRNQGASLAKWMVKAALGNRIRHRHGSFDAGELCAKARRGTGLEDFGTLPVAPALTVLADSLDKEANLHPLGRSLMRSHLLGLLKTRLRLVEAWKRAPQDSNSVAIEKPIFITGMPRSGSTFLHELLANDPALRAPRVWEVMFPVSAGQPDKGWLDHRVWNAAMCLWIFRRLVPQSDAVYPVRARTPHECLGIHSYTMLSGEFVSCCRVPRYESYMRSSNLKPVYQWEKNFLRHLQKGQASRRWVLKTPDHVFGLEALFSVFPDAVIIQTHRNPLDVLKSTIHLTRALQGLYSYPDDPAEHAGEEARMLATATDRIIQFRDAHPELAERFIDVSYSELTSAPSAVINRIYQHLGMPLSQQASENIQSLTRQRSRYPGRRSVPSLGEMGLNAYSLADRFEFYCRRFGVATARSPMQ